MERVRLANGARVAYMRDEGMGAEEADLEVDFGHLGLSRRGAG